MKRKISILTLAFLFFASTTALPVTLHYCEMMQSASVEVCDMHKEEVIKTFCCEDENETEIYFTSGYDTCCSDKLIDSSIKDNFVISKTELLNKLHLALIIVFSSSSDFENSYTNNFYSDTSPPPLIDNDLYLNNSVLLI